MSETELFEAIRREDVVIFAGAGFSRYAGYPTGGQLGQYLFDALTAQEQKKVNVHAPLDHLAEDIVRLKHGSRDLLDTVLDGVFTKPPVNLADHELVAAIPHFKTIITTNYDTLFEQVYGSDISVIFRESDILKWGDNKLNLLKIHGDISDKSSIILTREDYSLFYGKDYSSPFWATIIKEIATKTILFLGYGYEDPNIWAIFKHVYEHLGDLRKPAYFVGPDQDEEKIHFLNSKGIHYLNHTGETFLNALFKNIQDNIFRDIDAQWVSPETFRKFTSNHKVSVTLKDAGGSFKVQSIQGSDGKEMHGNMKFTLGAQSDFPERYNAFFNKGQFQELTLGQEELSSFRMDVEGLKLFGDGELSEISIKKMPKEIPFDLVFASQGLEIRNLTAHIFTGKKSINIKTKIHTLNFELTINMSNPADIDAKWSMEHDAIYRNVNEEIEVHQFLKNFFEQKEVSIYLNKDTKITKACPTYNAAHIKQAENFLIYFNALKEVERAFGVRFAHFYDIDKESSDDLNTTLKVIRGEKFVLEDTIEFSFGELSSELLGKLENLKDSKLPLELYINSNRRMLLHGQSLAIPGEHIQVPLPRVTNLDELKQGTTKKLKIKSGSGEIHQFLRIEPFAEAFLNQS
ncbi:SIR2 family protein [Mucilaginibacter sabulilitoris]|uniref:SIR2 family protein n=1 Tax=Mucilaginibacter sabulilitoris TaxID=1173583 RepID=A0ABZ0TXP0_9SPHI|nr:SIR2 family protein [Mucilaginibacter sabulilitoris]WPU96230.1 SIR2 family protein [Mucilaginibacter sabulilitoris]